MKQPNGTITPKEAFDLAVQMERERKQRIMDKAKEMEESYQHWFWKEMGIEEVIPE